MRRILNTTILSFTYCIANEINSLVMGLLWTCSVCLHLVCFQVNPTLLPPCEHYFRSQGFDFKLSNGRVVLVRRTHHIGHGRRLVQNGIPLDPGHALQIIPRQSSVDQSGTWNSLGFVRVMEGAGLIFTVDNVPSSLEYRLVIHYEPQVTKTFRCFCFES